MTRKRWYFHTLFLPYVLPLLVMLVARLTHHFMDGNSLLGWLSLIAVIELVTGGFQYAMFLYFVYNWAKAKPARQIARVIWALPLWYWPWYTVWLLAVTGIIHLTHLAMLAGLFAIPYGYFYAALVSLMTWGLEKTGTLKEPTDA